MEKYDIDKIQAYLTGNLSEAEKDFLNNDEAFARDLAFYINYKKSTDELLASPNLWISYKKYVISGIAALLVVTIGLFLWNREEEILLGDEFTEIKTLLDNKTRQDSLMAKAKLKDLIKNNSASAKDAKILLEKLEKR